MALFQTDKVCDLEAAGVVISLQRGIDASQLSGVSGGVRRLSVRLAFLALQLARL